LHEDAFTFTAEIVLEWEVFQIKVAEEIKTHILCSVTPPPPSFLWKSSRLWDNVENCGGAREATNDNTAHALCMLVTKGTDRICNTAFRRQEWFRERSLNVTLYGHWLSLLWAFSVKWILFLDWVFARCVYWRRFVTRCGFHRYCLNDSIGCLVFKWCYIISLVEILTKTTAAKFIMFSSVDTSGVVN
jgi:hypothetical protein